MLSPSKLAWLVPFAAISTVAGLAGCSDKTSDTGAAPAWCGPIADAGADQSTALGASVTLDGTGSNMGDGCPAQDLTYTWIFESVPADSEVTIASLSDNGTTSASQPEFVPDELGVYVLSLQVCYESDCSDTDLVVVTVSAEDAAPIADAGEDKDGEVDVRVELDGSGSYDPDGDPLTYAWALSEVPECSALSTGNLYNPSSEIVSLVPDCEGLFLLALVVSDGTQYSDPDYAVVEVSTDNQPPVANAGESTSNAPCDGFTLSLDGNGSYDPEGAALSYEWSVVSVPVGSSATDANFEDPTEAAPTFYWDVEGEYVFQLQVKDDEQWSAPDMVAVVVAETSNRAPFSNAGEDESMELSAACLSTGGYTFECDDCSEISFTVDGTSSEDPDGDTLSYHWVEESGTLVISSPYTAVTQVTAPSMPAEYGEDATATFTMTLTVEDCENEDADDLQITVVCSGE